MAYGELSAVCDDTGPSINAEGCRVPYVSVEDLPPAVQAHLPLHAQEIYLGAFNSAWKQYADRSPAQREEIAHRVAWAGVKRRYQKSGNQWIPREPD
jgi:cation transport regulator